MKEGEYCIYKGKEYEIEIDEKGNCCIFTEDPTIIDHSFHGPDEDGYYEKKIKKKMVQDIYTYNYYAIVDGDRVAVLDERDDYVLIGTANYEIAKKLNMDRTDKYYYEKWMDKDSVIIHTEKENY